MGGSVWSRDRLSLSTGGHSFCSWVAWTISERNQSQTRSCTLGEPGLLIAGQAGSLATTVLAREAGGQHRA
jgi:hypothetical protein